MGSFKEKILDYCIVLASNKLSNDKNFYLFQIFKRIFVYVLFCW